MNSVNLIGRLTHDPELRQTPTGIAVCSFQIAIDRPRGENGNEADFITVTAWRKVAENCATYLSKGKKVGVTGRLRQSSYDDQSGVRRNKVEVIAFSVEFLSPRDASATSPNYQTQQAAYQPQQTASPAAPPMGSSPAAPPPPQPMNQQGAQQYPVDDDDIPF